MIPCPCGTWSWHIDRDRRGEGAGAGGGEHGMGGECLICIESLFWKLKRIWRWMAVMVLYSVRVLHATDFNAAIHLRVI